MGGIGEWLQELGLEKYAPVFAEHEITREILPDLTEADIDRLGLPTGPRRRLMVAVQALRPLAETRSSVRLSSAPSEQTRLSQDAERRQLTVLFCDLVGSTELATKLDPEQLRDLMHAYQRACGEVIARYEGHVAQYLGDGLMVYFGWPRAHEDDAVRAIRAGLEVTQAVSQLNAAPPLRTRVGIHTGLVVVGETGQGDASVPKAAVGETPNIAARLQALAEPGSVLVSERTCSLVGGLFNYTDLGSHVLKGVSQPMHLFSVAGSRTTGSRFEATRGGIALTPLVGREEEVPLLLRRWQRACDGEGQVVLISGEPGIGKSRLTQVLRGQIEGQTHATLRYQCSSYHLNSALYPVIEQFAFAAGFAREDTPEQKLDKMEAALAGSAEQITESAPLFAALLSLPIHRYPPLKLSPQKQKEKTLEALAGQIEALARKAPVLMVFEDVQWIDPTSQESLDVLLPRLHSLPVLLVLTYRPEYTPAWVGQPNVTSLILNRLGRRQGAELVAKVAGGKTLPQEVLDQILAHTDGVPLFIEELTKSVLESKLLREAGDRYVLDGPLPALAIPTTLRDSLIARLDRLAPVREIAQIGACIGREFSSELLARLSPLKGESLQEALEQLTNTGLVFRRGTPPDAAYIFKHALVQDAAHESLLKSKRQDLHAKIAEAIQDGDPDKPHTEPELLAYHLTEAGLNDRAAPLWAAAGERALSRMWVVEAIAHLNTALRVNALLASSTQRDQHELDIRMLLSDAYLYRGGWAAIEIITVLRPARELAIRLGRGDKLGPILTHVRNHHALRCEFPQAFAAVYEVHRLARSSGDSSVALLAHWLEAEVRCWAGDLVGARRCGDQVLASYEPEKHAQIIETHRHDPKCSTLLWAGYWLWALGYPDQARQAADEALEYARRLGQVWNLVWVLVAGNNAFFLRKEINVVLQREAEAQAIASEHGLSFMQEFIRWRIGIARIGAGEYERGYQDATVGEAIFRASDALLVLPWSMGERAKALAALGRMNEATALLEEALQITERTGHRMWEAETRHIAGLVAMAGPDPDVRMAETWFLKSLEVARAQQARGFELRTAISLVRLWQTRGKRREAFELLAPVYHWFTEGLDTKDLQEARALLDELP